MYLLRFPRSSLSVCPRPHPPLRGPLLPRRPRPPPRRPPRLPPPPPPPPTSFR